MAIVNQFGNPVTASDYADKGSFAPLLGKDYQQKGDQDKVWKVLRIFQSYSQAYKPIFNIQKQCIDVLNDRHWTQEELNYAAKQNRTLLTINVTRPYSMQVAGMQRMSRTDMSVEPVDMKGDPKVADFAQKILQGIDYTNRQDIGDSLWFQDGMSGIGNMETYINQPPYSDEPFGEVISRRCEPGGVMHDIECWDPMMTDCKAMIRMVYMWPDDIRDKYGKAAALRFDDSEYDYWSNWISASPIPGFNTELNPPTRLNGKYIVMELYERKRRITRKIIDKQSGMVLGAFDWPNGTSKQFEEMFPQYRIVAVGTPVMRTTAIMPYYYTILSEAEEEFFYYPCTPFASIRNGARLHEASSYNYSMLGLQTKLNIHNSNIEEYVTRSIRGGYWVFTQGVDGKALMMRMDEFGHRIGQNFEIDGPPGSQPAPITPVNILPGEAFLADKDLAYFERVTGLNAVAVNGGNDQPGESGKHRAQRREESQTTLYQIIDDFNHMRSVHKSAVLERAMSILNPMQAVRIIGEDGNATYLTLAADVIQNLRQVTKWDIRILNGPFATSQKEVEKETMLDLTEITGKYLPEAVAPILPRIWRQSGLKDADDIANEIETIIQAKVQASVIAPSTLDTTMPSSSGLLPAVA